jgi:hypothetical protein
MQARERSAFALLVLRAMMGAKKNALVRVYQRNRLIGVFFTLEH